MTVTLVSGGTTDLRARKEMTTYTEPVSGGLLYITALRGSQGIVGIASTFVPQHAAPAASLVSVFAACNDDGSPVATGGLVSANASQFTLNSIPGTATTLDGHSVKNAIQVDTATWSFQLPGDYTAGTDLTATVNANYTGAGAAGACTVALAAYRVGVSGGHSGTMVATAPQAIAAAAAGVVFTIVGATLSPGDGVLLRAVMTIAETANVNTLTGHINSVQISHT